MQAAAFASGAERCFRSGVITKRRWCSAIVTNLASLPMLQPQPQPLERGLLAVLPANIIKETGCAASSREVKRLAAVQHRFIANKTHMRSILNIGPCMPQRCWRKYSQSRLRSIKQNHCPRLQPAEMQLQPRGLRQRAWRSLHHSTPRPQC